jgi:hypothetical protein
MSFHFTKITAVLIFSFLVFAGSCQIDKDDINTNDSVKLQVYNEDGTPFKETVELFGLPLARLDTGYYPWKLYGRIVNGKMAIDFPDVKLELGSSLYCSVSIELKNSGSTRFGLHKPGGDYDSQVYIYYSTGSYETDVGIQFKAGWNFVEELKNPDWSYDSDEPYRINGLITNNIIDIYNKGYRWQLERWT